MSLIRVQRDDVRSKCCCPTLILAGGGSWLGVLGGVFTDKVIVQRLTDMMWIAHSSTYEDARVYQLAQVLSALRESLLDLETFYKSLFCQDIPQLKPNKPHPRFFPYLTLFPEGNEMVQFDYVKPLEDSATCVAFLAETKDNSQIVVKFVDRYGRAVHEFLAERGYAPRLRYCGPLSLLQTTLPPPPSAPGLSFGPLQMVVMDYVKPLSRDLPQAVRPQIEQMLRELHRNGYVFGDLREPNIILNQANKIQLIDFDWAGQYDMTIQDSIPDDLQGLIPADVLEPTNVIQAQTYTTFAHYPLNLSKPLFSSTGAGDLQPIRPIHDWRMLNKLKLTH